MTDIPNVATQTEASAVDLMQQAQTEFSHLFGVRKLVYGDRGQYERLQAHTFEQEPDDPHTGYCHWVLGHFEEACDIFERRLDQPGVRAALASTYCSMGLAAKALETIPSPTTPDEAKARAQALFRLRRENETAATELEKLRTDPGMLASTAYVPFLEGAKAEDALDVENAIAAYAQAYELDPQLADNSFHLARLLELHGNEDEALEIYEEMIQNNPVNNAALMNMGLLYEDLEEWSHAERCYRTILKTDPNNERAQLFLEDVAASKVMLYDEDQERREDRQNEILRTPVTDFELSVRSRNCLAKMGIRTLGDLVRKTEAELLSYKNFGETSLFEIQEILQSKGLRLGMDREDLFINAKVKSGQLDLTDPRNRPIEELNLSVRSRRIIEMFKLKLVGDLSEKTEAELMACPNFGQTSLNEIKAKLDERGLALKG